MNVITDKTAVPETIEEFDEVLLNSVTYMHENNITYYWNKWQEGKTTDFNEFLNWVIEKEKSSLPND